MFSIGDLSRRTGVKIPTIRYYEQKNMIDAEGRTDGNQRRYGADGLARLTFIRHARDLGLSLEDIRDLLALSQQPDMPCAEAHVIASKHLQAIRNRIAHLARLQAELDRILSVHDTGSIGTCHVIQALADHGQCADDHQD
ncbi:MerR family transcriptional regulator [Pseudogemmobacter sp. W21_MBD1_M6]|uniref:MerR family transcriptional regulator n=1 Tax=Pseudogemmobacter sp. W21_MBD1_M6 TaxID=3240271 RepID=UPI003F964145